MITNEIYSFYGLLISNALLLAAATIAVLRLQRMLDRSDSFWNSPTGAHVKEQNDMGNISGVVNDRLRLLQETVDDLVKKDNSLQLGMTESRPFKNAVRMVKLGASVEDITRNCGLSESEARLLVRVHSGTSENERLTIDR